MANILAVDDNLEVCKLICTALERDGHRVETRQAGGALTEPLCRWADCILLDVMMPREDGFAVCRRIRSLTEAPILFLSARTDEAAVLEGLGIGADDFLLKPFRVAELRARVAAHLRRQSRTPAHRMVRSGIAFDLTARSAAVARKDLDSAVFSGAKVREYESALQALQTMGDELTGSLQKQWDMEQRQREQIIQLSHKLKTPLTIIEGNAELLAEDDLTEEQRAQVEAILQGAEQTRTYLGKIRAEVQTPLKYRQRK